ncbi:MAG TPA: hypothetical protein VLM40_18135 [Gemmata sp.]|nr:hypothetical protein [Gemmata sp.]
MLPSTARLSAKLHRRVCLVLTEDVVLAEELLARKKLSMEVAGRLSEKVLLIRPGRVDAVLEELRKMGHTPQVVSRPGERPN